MKNNIFWLTGQPGSGKTTIALQLIETLKDSNIMHIDGDDLRDLTSNKDYSRQGRINNITLAQKIALFCSNKGFFVIVSLVAPFKDIRDAFKKNNSVTEFYLHTDEVRGKEEFFSKDYEAPSENFISIDTGVNTIDECVSIVMKELEKKST